MHRNASVQRGGLRSRDSSRKTGRGTKIPAGHRRVVARVTVEVKHNLGNIAGMADAPQTLTAQILVSMVSGSLQHFASFPHPHIEKCTQRIEFPLPVETFERWTKLAGQQGFLGLSSYICWALDAVGSAAPADELAKLVRTRPDLRKVIKWAKNAAS